MSRSLPIWAALIALTLPLAACAGFTAAPQAAPSSAPTFPMTVQNCGQQVTIPKEPKQIVTIGYEAVNIINAAGGASRIVATFDNIKDPADPAFTAVPHPELASDKDPTTETVLALRPDLVASYGLFDVNLASLQQSEAASLIVSGLCGQHGGGRVATVSKDGKGRTAVHGYFCCGGFFTSGNQSMLQSQMDALGLKTSSPTWTRTSSTAASKSSSNATRRS